MSAKNNGCNAKEDFLVAHRAEWQQIGQQLKNSRIQLDLSRNQVANSINISSNRLRNLEMGNPVYDAKVLIAAYNNFIKLKVFERALKYNALLLIKS